MSPTACTAAGCTWWPARLYASKSGGAPVCENGTAIEICTYFEPGVFSSPADYRRDTAEGRIVLDYGWGTTVTGFQVCDYPGMLGDCDCFP